MKNKRLEGYALAVDVRTKSMLVEGKGTRKRKVEERQWKKRGCFEQNVELGMATQMANASSG